MIQRSFGREATFGAASDEMGQIEYGEFCFASLEFAIVKTRIMILVAFSEAAVVFVVVVVCFLDLLAR